MYVCFFREQVHAGLQNPIAIVYWSSSYETVPSKSRFDKIPTYLFAKFLLKLFNYCSSVRYKKFSQTLNQIIDRLLIFLRFQF